MQIIYELSGKSALDFSARIGYNDTAPIWTGIEVVITALTRNQVVSQEARGFESHPVRQKGTTAHVAVVPFCIPRGGFERERCKKTCRRHVFPATEASAAAEVESHRSPPEQDCYFNKNGNPVFCCRFAANGV